MTTEMYEVTVFFSTTATATIVVEATSADDAMQQAEDIARATPKGERVVTYATPEPDTAEAEDARPI